jgi:hypothetical protein
METVSPERTISAPRSELAAVFAAAIRRLLEREALTSPISPELSASRLEVRPQPITLPEDSCLPLPGTILVTGTHINGFLFFRLQKGGRS